MELAPAISEEPLRSGLRPFSPASLYILVSAGLMAVWIGFYIFSPFGFDEAGRDSWHHAAVLRELMAHPFNPSNPHLPTGEASRYFTPVALVAALFGRAFAMSPYALFGFIGALNCIGFIAGCWLFGRRYYQSPWAPLILFLTLLFAWGAQMSHAGLHNYATWLSSAAYPATIALVLGLLSWALALAALSPNGLRVLPVVTLGALTSVTLLVHQLSAIFVLAGTGSLILFHGRAGMRAKAVLLAAMALGSLATLAWPYFPILEVISSGSDPRWKSVVVPMNRVSTVLLLAAPSLLGVLGFRKPEGGLRWELLLPAAFFGLVYVALVLQDSAIAHRIPAAVILYGQLGLVWLALDYGKRLGNEPRTRFVMICAVASAIAVLAFAPGAARMRDIGTRSAEGSMIAMAGGIASSMPPGSISFATVNIVFPLQSTGRRVVSIPRPEPAASSLPERQAATDRFFGSRTSNDERYMLIKRWHATHVVFALSDLRPEVVQQLRQLGPSKKFSRNTEVVTIDPARAAAQYAKARQ